MAQIKLPIYTIGHSTHKLSEFLEILSSYGITTVVDIRTIPKSRANPQFNERRLKSWLKKHRIKYLHMKGLGGLRRPDKDSTNTYWRNASFRGFADYMQTKEFKENLAKLIELSRKRKTAIMCAEAVPWRCHRSLIADALSVRRIKAYHIFSMTNSKEHRLTKSAVVKGDNIIYK